MMDDLISRAAAIAAIEEYLQGLDSCMGCPTLNWMGYRNGLQVAIHELNELPAVDAVPVVHGRWIKMTGMLPPEYHGHYECSECQWHLKGIRSSWTREEELRLCPNCGALMDGERRDADD